MNNMNMPNIPMAGPVGGPSPMMANTLAAQQQQVQSQGNNRTVLNTYIYDYFLREGMFDCARQMLKSEQTLNVIKESPGRRRDENGNVLGNGVGDDPMDTDSKDDIDSKRPSDLPLPNVPAAAENSFLYEWFCLFWDMLYAQRNKPGISPQVSQYVNHTQQQNRQKQTEQQAILRGMRQDLYGPRMMGMPNGMQINQKQQQQNLARTAMANNQNPQAMHMLQQAKQNQMQRDGSNMDGNQNRPGSPGQAENAPSPSKRPRLDSSGPFNPQQGGMMPNGQRPQQGMPGQQVGNGPRNTTIAGHMLSTNGINPASLSPEQFQNFQSQPPQTQAKSIQTYSQNLQQHHGQQITNKQMPNPGGPQGQSPMMQGGPNDVAITALYNPDGMGGPGVVRPGAPGGAQGAGGSNHALQDYQMQLMLLEQQNKKRLMMARQEQDSMGGIPRPDGAGPGGPGAPGGPGPNGQAFQDPSAQGGRSGASPNPADQMKRNTPQMNPATIPSPLTDGAQSRGSPNQMNFVPNGMDPNMQGHFFKNMNGMDSNMVTAAQMNGGGMRPPSSHPNQPFNGQMNPQMMRPQQGAQGGPPMQWQQGPNGNAMAPQGPQGPQGQVQGTPQQRSMPPPSAPPVNNGAGGRSTSSPQQNNAAPPTPQQSNKAAPKKKDTKNAKNKNAAQKKANQAPGATPASEAAQEPEPPTPVTPVNTTNFNKNGQVVAAQPTGNAAVSAPPPVPAPVAAPQAHPDPSQINSFGMDNNSIDFGAMPSFADPMQTGDVLQDFDFDSFLHDGDADPGTFDFGTGPFGMEGAGEIGAE
ncbi:hypothetical protein F5Y00DRAFT_271482 [Daldinia vernicosa]|uniref:uncharacterized protein n=1 Tax=Daldinia vernicosa TaxID=114800 RepID=UPI002008E745|nr:uncharacterized protein F5Y00DRAFT_271482 [Daldinia vernicosa]KAI0847012.1 hypothetical protein F5Y00DRAFT_271482 [Daldinia vernicosa]